MNGELSTRVSSALARAGWNESAPGAWATRLTNGTLFPVWAVLEGEWLRVEAELTEIPGASPWRLLSTSGLLPFSIRPAFRFFSERVNSVRLVADLQDDEDASWPALLSQVSDDLIASAKRVHEEVSEPVVEGAPLPGPAADAVRDAGWPLETHDDGTLSIPLDTAAAIDATAHAAFRDRALHLFVPLGSCSGAGEASAEATAIFLLLSAHRVRGVRPVVRPERRPSRLVAGWEIALPGEPGPERIDRALQALAIASRHSAREVRALASPALSLRYLELHNPGRFTPAHSIAAFASR